MPRGKNQATVELEARAAKRPKCFGCCNHTDIEFCVKPNDHCPAIEDCQLITSGLNKGYDMAKPEDDKTNKLSYIYPTGDKDARTKIEKLVDKTKEKLNPPAPRERPSRERSAAPAAAAPPPADPPPAAAAPPPADPPAAAPPPPAADPVTAPGATDLDAAMGEIDADLDALENVGQEAAAAPSVPETADAIPSLEDMAGEGAATGKPEEQAEAALDSVIDNAIENEKTDATDLGEGVDDPPAEEPVQPTVPKLTPKDSAEIAVAKQMIDYAVSAIGAMLMDVVTVSRTVNAKQPKAAASKKPAAKVAKKVAKKKVAKKEVAKKKVAKKVANKKGGRKRGGSKYAK